ncbi:VOC family protein [Salinigranum halophilum]|uniref:VOC family protein n=1 Tax=Salinigranum halophilum TaxID=2565931 RepID=UPI0010A7A29A|nr:VOC family protein [Salinigranum halophilum]
MAPFIHLCLNVTDADESQAFYEQFGFEYSRSFELAGAENRYVVDENGIELQLKDDPEVDEVDVGDAWDHLALDVDSVDEALEHIEHYGIVNGPMDVEQAGARVVFFEDPDGHVVELVESLD